MKYLLLFLLLATNAFAIEGHLEAKKYFKGNVPAHLDLTGKMVAYGLDFEFRETLLPNLLPIGLFKPYLMFGADSDSTLSGFSRVAGRFGAYAKLPTQDFVMGVYHRSNHNMDYKNTGTYKFISDNHFVVRYEF